MTKIIFLKLEPTYMVPFMIDAINLMKCYAYFKILVFLFIFLTLMSLIRFFTTKWRHDDLITSKLPVVDHG